MSQKARITYRFDNPARKPVQPQAASAPASALREELLPAPVVSKLERQRERNSPGSERQPASPYFQDELTFTLERDLSPWVSPFQDDAYALEKLIRESEPASVPYAAPEGREYAAPAQRQHAALAQRQPVLPAAGSASSSYIDLGEDVHPPLPESRPRLETGLGEKPIIRRHPVGPSWLKVFAAVAGAIATGALFGYMVLSLFSGTPDLPGAEGEVPTAGTQQEQIQQQETDPAVLPASGESELAAAHVPSGTYYLLQYGVFSNEEGMAAALAELRQKGLAGAASATDGYRVFAGMGTSRNSAVLLSEQLGGSEVYLKEMLVPEVSRLPFAGEVREAELFFEQTGDLIRLLNDLTLTLLRQEQPQRLQARDAEVWRAAHQQWTATAAAVSDGWDASARDTAEGIVTKLQTAAVSLDEYDKNPSRAHLWTAQSAMMEAVILQKDWLAQIDALS
ncbi:SPOR domain-containing protein [Paenibacillus sp. 1P07SE]|uniref:SPOR domain-containing protein n=1 Tax=Paenibacillus sp. 1P07SE TaxID=3132209 RepID=UPI0039A41C66